MKHTQRGSGELSSCRLKVFRKKPTKFNIGIARDTVQWRPAPPKQRVFGKEMSLTAKREQAEYSKEKWIHAVILETVW